MFKHANTLVPGDRVTRMGSSGKTASEQGEVVDYDAESEKFKVKFSTGVSEWLPPSDLQKS